MDMHYESGVHAGDSYEPDKQVILCLLLFRQVIEFPGQYHDIMIGQK